MGDMISEYGLQQLIKTPTRVSKTKLSIIDHIYTNKIETILDTNVPNYSISDHMPICFTRFTGKHQLSVTTRFVIKRDL